jgi:hypothetical protein
MTRAEIIAALQAIERQLAGRVELWRVIIDEHGVPTGQRFYSGSFSMPSDWRPPKLEDLMTRAKGRRTHE